MEEAAEHAKEWINSWNESQAAVNLSEPPPNATASPEQFNEWIAGHFQRTKETDVGTVLENSDIDADLKAMIQ